MLAGLVKETEGFMSRRVERPISLAITRRLIDTGLSPNAMTLISVAVGLAAAPCFLVSGGQWQIVGAILFLAHSILDGCDGELARLRHQQSRLGGIMDFWGDNVVHAAIFFCMGLGWARFEGSVWPLAAGVVAATVTFGAAGFIYWTTMRDRTASGPLFTSTTRGPESALSRLLDALSRRDFIYLVLVLALFGRAHWFVAVVAVGTPLYFVLLIAVSIIPLRHAR